MRRRLAIHLLLALALLGSAIGSTVHVSGHAAADLRDAAHAAAHPGHGHVAGEHRIDLREALPGSVAPEGIDELADCLGLHLFCGSQGGVAAPPPALAARLGAGVPIRTALPRERGAPDPFAPPIRAPPALS